MSWSRIITGCSSLEVDIHGVGGTWDSQPVSGAIGADDAAGRGRASGDAEGHGEVHGHLLIT
jgi:hypothetical protein